MARYGQEAIMGTIRFDQLNPKNSPKKGNKRKRSIWLWTKRK